MAAHSLPLVLIAEDDPDDRLILQDALDESEYDMRVEFVHDGKDLLDYLENVKKESRMDMLPQVIILDLNMPRVDGRQALEYIKKDDSLKSIPTIVLTTSKAAEDIHSTYLLGVNSFITKPPTFKDMVKITDLIGAYWLNTVKLPR